MTRFDFQYWDKKALTYGHTGNADPFVYCFDQAARIFVINSILQKKNVKNARVLDFGCGSGDFIEQLLIAENSVAAYDISAVMRDKVKARFGDKIVLTENTVKLEKLDPFQFILTVTVLQHLTFDAVDNCLALFKKCLDKSGEFICMEFFPLSPTPENTYVCLQDWLSLLEKHNLCIIETYQIYNPIEFPVNSWKAYQNNIFIKMLKPIKQSQVAGYFMRLVANKLIRIHRDIFCERSGAYRVYIIGHKSNNH